MDGATYKTIREMLLNTPTHTPSPNLPASHASAGYPLHPGCNGAGIVV